MARGGRAPAALAAVVIVLGLAFAIVALLAPGAQGPNERTADIDTFEAAGQARQPIWISFLNPLIGAAGVMIGSRIAGGAPAAATV